MSISSEIERIQSAKSDIITAIENKGVTVPTGATIDELPELIDSIPGGGGGGGGGIGDIVNYFSVIDGVIPNSSDYNIIDLGQNYNAEDTTIEFSFYETINLDNTNGNFAGIGGIDGSYWIELLGHAGAKNLRFRINDSYLPKMWPLYKGLYKFVLNGSNCNLNDVNYTVNAPTSPIRYIRIGCSTSNTGSDYRKPAIKEIKTTVSGNIKSHLIAVKRLTDDRPSLFDVVRGYFDYNHTYTSYIP